MPLFTSVSDQNPLLPRRNVDGRFSSVSRHTLWAEHLCAAGRFPYTPFMLSRPRALPAGFIAPCLPTKAPHPPSGEEWLHEIKHDGFRVIARKNGKSVRLYSRPGNDHSVAVMESSPLAPFWPAGWNGATQPGALGHNLLYTRGKFNALRHRSQRVRSCRRSLILPLVARPRIGRKSGLQSFERDF
jgi:hypothetical protein